jgi:hypothetical protein
MRFNTEWKLLWATCHRRSPSTRFFDFRIAMRLQRDRPRTVDAALTFLLLVIFSVLHAAAQSAGSASTGGSAYCTPGRWCRLVTTDSAYRLSSIEPRLAEYLVLRDVVLTREQAISYCAARSATLVSFESTDVTRTLLTLLPAASWAGAWTGLQFNAQTGSYVFASDLSTFTMSPDMPVMHSRAACYAFTTGPLGLAVEGVACDTTRAVACQRINANSGWKQLSGAATSAYFTAPSSRDEAEQVCAYYKGTLGFIPSFRYVAVVSSEADSFGAATSTDENEPRGMWVQLEFDSASHRFVWNATYGSPTWVPSVDNRVNSECVMLRSETATSTEGLSTELCSALHGFMCTRAYPVVTVSLPPIAQWAAAEGRRSGAQDAATGTVTLSPPLNRRLVVGLREAHPAELALDTTFVIFEAGETRKTFTVNRIGAVSLTYIVPTVIGEPQDEFQLRPGRLVFDRSRTFSLSRSLHRRTRSWSMSLSAAAPFTNGTSPLAPRTPRPPPAPTKNRAGVPVPVVLPSPTPVPNPRRMIGFTWPQPTSRVMFVGTAPTADRRVDVYIDRWTPPAGGIINVVPSVMNEETGQDVTNTLVTPLLPTFNTNAFSFYLAVTTPGFYRISFTFSCSWYTYNDLPQPIRVQVKPLVQPVFIPPNVVSMRVTSPPTTYQATIDAVERPRTTLTFTASVARGSASIRFPNGAAVTFSANSYWTSQPLNIQCQSEGDAEIALYPTTRPSYYLDTTLYIRVICTAPASFGLSEIITPQLTSPTVQQRVTITIGQLPTSGREVSVKLTHSASGGACFVFSPPSILWTSTSSSVRTFTIQAVQACAGNVVFALSGSAALDYSVPAAVPLTSRLPATVDVDAAPGLNQTIIGSQLPSPATVIITPSVLPNAGETIEVALRITGAAAAYAYVQPSSIVIVGGSGARSSYTATILSSYSTAQTRNFLAPATVKIEPVIQGGSASALLQPGRAAPIGFVPASMVTLSLAAVEMMVGTLNAILVTVSFGTLPAPNTAVEVSWRSPGLTQFFNVEPLSIVLTSTATNATATFTFTGVRAGSGLFADLLISGNALRQYRFDPFLVDADDSTRTELLRSQEDRRTLLRKTIPVTVTERAELSVAKFPTLLYLNDETGDTFYVTAPVDKLADGEMITIVVVPLSIDVGVVPTTFSWRKGDASTVAFKLLAWGNPQTAATFYVNVTAAPKQVATKVTPSNTLVTQTAAMVNCRVDVPDVLYVGQRIGVGVSLRLRPGGDDFLSESTAPAEFTFLTLTPQYNGTERAMTFSPQLVTFDNTRVKPLTASVLLEANVASPASKFWSRLTGPSGSDFFSPTRYVEIRQVNVTISGIPSAMYAGEYTAFDATISHLPTCGEYQLSVGCDQCDAFLVSPAALRWTATSPSRRVQLGLLAVSSTQTPLNVSYIVTRSCSETAVAIPVYSDANNITIAPRFSPKLYYASSDASERREATSIIVTNGGYVDLELDITEPATSLKAPRPSVDTWFDVFFTEGGAETLALSPSLLTVTATTPTASLRVSGFRQRDGVNASLRIESRNVYRYIPITVPLIVADKVLLRVTGISSSTSCVKGTAIVISLAAGGVPASGYITVSLDAPQLNITSSRTSWRFSRSDALAYDISAVCWGVNASARLRILASGPAESFYEVADPLTFAVLDLNGLLVNTTPPLPANITLAAGQQKTVKVKLLAAPPDTSANVWVQPISTIAGALTFEPRAVYWSAETGFGIERTIVATAVTQPSDPLIQFVVSSPVAVFESPSSIVVPLSLRGEQSLKVTNHRTAAAWGTGFMIIVYLSALPPTNVYVRATARLTAEAQARLPVGVVVDVSAFISIYPTQVLYTPTNRSDSLNASFGISIVANATTGEQDFDVTYEVVGSTEFGPAQVYPLDVISSSKVGISNWKDLVVASPGDQFTFELFIANLPPNPTLLVLQLDTMPDILTFSPKTVFYGSVQAFCLSRSPPQRWASPTGQ